MSVAKMGLAGGSLARWVGSSLILLASCARTPSAVMPEAPKRAAPSSAPTQPIATPHNQVPAVATIDDLVAMDLRASVGKYQATSAVWVPARPLAINRDFDFATALGGASESAPALAAQKRQTDNLALAQKLSAVTPFSPETLRDALLARCTQDCEPLQRAQVIRIYGFLFGDQPARLRVVLEIDRDEVRAQYAAVGQERSGQDFTNESILQEEVQLGIDRVANLLRVRHEAASIGARRLCAIGGRETIPGNVVEESGDQVVLSMEHDRFESLVSCPIDAIRQPHDAPDPSLRAQGSD